MSTIVTPGTYSIDTAHTNVEFAVRHMMISTVKGNFGDVKGTLTVSDSGDIKVDATIATGSIDTRNEMRDNHLKSGDFFDVEKYPEMRFVSTKVERTAEGYKLTGDLTIKDVTKPVTLTVTEEGAGVDPWGNQKVAFSATGKFNRGDFGLGWNAALETGGVLVSDEVKLSIDTQLAKQAAAKAA
ncbi:MAG TPA: YceI family protein [Gemmatimonadaceae bacterium]|nr:YceI family protein [Gemmatimonadaceae bacterium]